MALITIQAKTCDLCPETDEIPAVETVTVVTSTGAQFDNDVCQDHYDSLRMGRRHTRGDKGKGRARKTAGSNGGARRPRGVSNNDIRAWAEQNAVDVAPRGKLPKSVVEAYRAAH